MNEYSEKKSSQPCFYWISVLSPKKSEYSILLHGEFIPYVTFTRNPHTSFGLTGSPIDCHSLELSRIQFLLTNAVKYYSPFYSISFLPHCHGLMEMPANSCVGTKYKVSKDNDRSGEAECPHFSSRKLVIFYANLAELYLKSQFL